jgi:hypothetical protein
MAILHNNLLSNGRKIPWIFRTHQYIIVLTGTCRWFYLKPEESSSLCHPRIKSKRKYLFHSTVNAKGRPIWYIPLGPNINNDMFAFYYISSAHSSWGQTFTGAEPCGILYDKLVMNFYIEDLFVCTVYPEGSCNVFIWRVNEFYWKFCCAKRKVIGKQSMDISTYVMYRFCHS